MTGIRCHPEIVNCQMQTISYDSVLIISNNEFVRNSSLSVFNKHPDAPEGKAFMPTVASRTFVHI